MVFKYRSEKEALKFRDLTKEEIAVYEVVMQSGNSGISTIDIKIKFAHLHYQEASTQERKKMDGYGQEIKEHLMIL